MALSADSVTVYVDTLENSVKQNKTIILFVAVSVYPIRVYVLKYPLISPIVTKCSQNDTMPVIKLTTPRTRGITRTHGADHYNPTLGRHLHSMNNPHRSSNQLCSMPDSSGL